MQAWSNMVQQSWQWFGDLLIAVWNFWFCFSSFQLQSPIPRPLQMFAEVMYRPYALRVHQVSLHRIIVLIIRWRVIPAMLENISMQQLVNALPALSGIVARRVVPFQLHAVLDFMPKKNLIVSHFERTSSTFKCDILRSKNKKIPVIQLFPTFAKCVSETSLRTCQTSNSYEIECATPETFHPD